MAFDLTVFDDPPLNADYLSALLGEATERAVHFERMMAYYRNEMRDGSAAPSSGHESGSSRPYTQAQEFGLPPRLTGLRHDGFGAIFGGQPISGASRKEVVVENDIAWRIDTMIDFLFAPWGRAHARPTSEAADPALRERIDAALSAMFAANGGGVFWEQMGLLAHVYGFVDVVLRVDEMPTSGDAPEQAASRIVLELVEADRAVPILNESDYRRIDHYVQHFRQRVNACDAGGAETSVMVTEILGPRTWQRYHDGDLVAEGVNPLGEIPVVHLQNVARPFCYEGYSDVERLIPIQDELNTRLSDRANRINYQAFRMYLARGMQLDGQPVGPGRMLVTDNPDASIQEFGGDSGSPSEDAHIVQVREAMDKISGVPPVSAGLLRGRVGNLTSSNALRLTLMPILVRTRRKQGQYGRAIQEICRLALTWLNAAGVLETRPEDRLVRVDWPDLLPDNDSERLQEALLKQQLGIPEQTILAELGYGKKE